MPTGRHLKHVDNSNLPVVINDVKIRLTLISSRVAGRDLTRQPRAAREKEGYLTKGSSSLSRWSRKRLAVHFEVYKCA